MTLQTIANRVNLEHHLVQVQLFNDYGILESVSCRLGFFSDGVQPKMRQQRALGSYSKLTSLRDCPDFPGVAECGFTPHKIRAERSSIPCAG